jgi:mRNA interferase YafQ
MLRIRTTTKFDRDLKRSLRRGKDAETIKTIMQRLAQGEKLEPKYFDHKLKGEFGAHRECHLQPDWLLVYRITDDEIIFERTGSHSDLFE